MMALARVLIYTTMLAALVVAIFFAVRTATQDDAGPTGVVEATTRQLWESPPRCSLGPLVCWRS